MALLHEARLTPSKLDTLREWVPAQDWANNADTSQLHAIGAYRFDDPAGEVGIETHLLRTVDDQIVQVPLTYRPEPRSEGDPIATVQHSVLGKRWIYDGCTDPVYIQELARTILNGGSEAVLEVQTANGLQRREPTVRVRGSGSPDSAVPAVSGFSGTTEEGATIVSAGDLRLMVLRVLGMDASRPLQLAGMWAGQNSPVLLAFIRS